MFDIDKTDPWRHKWVPDPGRIPARKPSVCRPRFLHKIQPMVSQVKRLLSVPGYSEDEEETSNSSDGRKRSRTTVTSHNWLTGRYLVCSGLLCGVLLPAALPVHHSSIGIPSLTQETLGLISRLVVSSPRCKLFYLQSTLTRRYPSLSLSFASIRMGSSRTGTTRYQTTRCFSTSSVSG